ncbi:UvrD-like helicase, ATP-binding domain, P-loop containing nucleoside triphosphate hydrolase, partial [Tanacetum coccineum]
MDFIYMDEVQDLTMRQISLFKYICQNVDEGFVFAGDTAQTIARGVDFRFQDIRALFYKEFLSSRTTDKQDKGLVSEIKQLKQNFRTHAAVLNLAQSVIDIIYHYFIHSIDKLEPEVSLISGEAPLLLESRNDENAIMTIFGGSGEDNVGFGAEQVILVRDDYAKSEVCEFVGKNALVLTILECKGLEFQDVLLYNFFGSSPLKDQWRVIYGHMKKCDWLEEKLPQSFPTFNEARHSVLCSELKQLYVAITRTKQRLWICENKEEFSKPMFDYWKKRGLVQVRKLDDSMAQVMRVASSPQEWRERGKKLFYESNFVLATLCFERAGDTMWEKLAKASGLRTSADQMRGKNPEAFKGYLREAAEIFESIGKPESAATCYCDLGEYERAGKIYMNTCRKTEAAAECFLLAGRYSEAAEAYAKGNKFSKCLSVCKKGKLLDKGLQYIKYWKEHVNIQTKEIRQLEQEFLENVAHEHENPKSCAGEEDTTPKMLSSAFDTSPQKTEHSSLKKNLQGVVEWIQRWPKLDNLLNRNVIRQEPKAGQMVVSERSSTTKVKENRDDELVEVVFDRYCGNTPDAKNMKGKGKNKEKQGTTVKDSSDFNLVLKLVLLRGSVIVSTLSSPKFLLRPTLFRPVSTLITPDVPVVEPNGLT